MIDQELKKRALEPAAKGDPAPREKVLKVGKMITDVIEHKLGKVTSEDAEYWGLEALLTDEMCDIMLAMKVRKPHTVPELWKLCNVKEEDKQHFQEVLDKLAFLGLLEYDYGYHYDHNGRTAPQSERRYFVPMYVPGSAELLNIDESGSGEKPCYDERGEISYNTRLQEHPELATFFERMTYVPLAGKTHLMPPGGGGVGMHVIPVEKAIPMENQSLDIEHLSYWLKKYEGHIGVAQCSCRASRGVMGEGCADDPASWCIGVGDFADYCRETGKGHDITYEEAIRILEKAEENGFVHQITNIDGENKIFGICNCNVQICNALRTSQLFNTPNLSRSAYTAEVERDKCVACGKCVETCPAGAVKLGQKLCDKEGKVVEYPKHELPNSIKWGPEHWDPDYRDNNRKNCYDKGTAPCKTACPAHVAVQGYLKLAAQGKYQEALALIKKDNPFPAVCGRICNKRCEAECTRGDVDEAVAIDEVKRFIADHDLHEATRYVPKLLNQIGRPYTEKIAVIGAGPAGMSCAYYLANKGYPVTVFDRNPVPGGMLTLGIPSFRLEKDVLNAEIDILREMGVEFRCGVEVGKDVTIEQLRAQGYKGFYVAIGAQKSAKLRIPGEELAGVYGGVDFLRAVNLGQETNIGKRCAVIGGGNVAMDVCRSAVRLGADETYVLYRRSEAELPADPEEVKEAMEEGVQFRFLTAPVEILGADGKVTGIRVERMTLGEPDEKGRRKPVGTGEFETLAVDSVIGAIGQTVDWGTLDTGALTTTKKGTAEADALTYQTAQPDIFVGGDCYTGPKFAIDAIAAGKEAAISLHRYVHPGQTLTAGRDRRVYKALDKDHVLIETAGFDKDHRQTPGYNAAKAKTFSDARVTFTEEQVRKECARCLGCGATKVDSYLCIGCGLCTTKCKFDAIHLKKVRDWHAGSYETMPIKVAEGVVKRAGSIVKKAVSK